MYINLLYFAIIGFINFVCFIEFEINNSIFTTILIIIEVPILIWTVFTKCFNKFEDKKRLYTTKDIYQYIPLIENEEDLEYWEDILRKE